MKQKSKQRINFLSFILCGMLLSFIPMSFAQDLTEYEYHIKANVDCNEYIGYVKFDLPTEFNTIINPKVYSDNQDFYVQKKYDVINYQIQNNWYANKIDDFDVVEIEKLTDKNTNNYFLANNKEQITVKFQNPQFKTIDRIKVDIKDTVINSLKLYDSEGNIIDFNLKKELFSYYLDLNYPTNTNELQVEFNFDELLKIEEVSFYEEVITSQNAQMYFKIDNNCNKTFNFYFGNYGKDYSRTYTSQNLIKEVFNVVIETNKNSLYNDDFDSDTIKNTQDNCINLANTDQKDINYNNKGDACEDFDNDGIINQVDNCIDDYNRDQLDNDGDGIGNKCDENDDRLLESNKIYVYIGIVLICLLFAFLSFKIMKK